MPSLTEILRSLYGAYRLARFDPGGLAFFDATLEGFWRSFFAAVIVAPLYLVLVWVSFNAGQVAAAPGHFLAIELIAYVIDWLAYPVLMTTVVRRLHCERRYLSYMVAYNWASVWQNAVYLSLSILALSGAAGGIAGLINLIGLAAILPYMWFVARAGLQIPAPVAAALVGMDIGLSLVINDLANGLVAINT